MTEDQLQNPPQCGTRDDLGSLGAAEGLLGSDGVTCCGRNITVLNNGSSLASGTKR